MMDNSVIINFFANTVNVFCNNENKNELVFTGNVVNAYPEFSQVPNVFFNISAMTGYETSLFLDTPLSLNIKIFF